MKKSKINGLSLNKTTISNLDKNRIRGGDPKGDISDSPIIVCNEVPFSADCKSNGPIVCKSEKAATCWTWFFCNSGRCPDN